jgi:hypothetical protein
VPLFLSQIIKSWEQLSVFDKVIILSIIRVYKSINFQVKTDFSTIVQGNTKAIVQNIENHEKVLRSL